jgi:hypothetical protein
MDKHKLSKTDFELIEKGLNALLNSGPDPAVAHSRNSSPRSNELNGNPTATRQK